MTQRDCWHNLALRSLRIAWPNRSELDRPAYVTDRIIAGHAYMRPATLEDVMVGMQRLAERVLA